MAGIWNLKERDQDVFHVITGLTDGGAEAVLFRLCVADKAYRHSVVSLMASDKYGPMLEQAGVSVTYLSMPRGRVTVSGLWKLFRLLRTTRPDLVQTWMYHADLVGGVVARLAGVRRVFWGIHNTTLEGGKSGRVTMAIARLNAWLSRWVPVGIVCCAERAREVHRGLGYVNEKLMVIPNGYDLGRFRPSEEVRRHLRAEWGIEEVPLIGMVGRFDPQKDHANLIRALGLLKRLGIAFECVVVGNGTGPDNADLTSQMVRHGVYDNVRLLGPRNDISDVMNALDLLVLPSAFGEAFPNVLAEAMACGTPCVTTDVGDSAVIVGDTGWVVPPKDSEALAGAIQEALRAREDVSMWLRRKRAARARVEGNFSIDKMVQRYIAVWRDSKNEPKSPGSDELKIM